jgi:hypothetical protein
MVQENKQSSPRGRCRLSCFNILCSRGAFIPCPCLPGFFAEWTCIILIGHSPPAKTLFFVFRPSFRRDVALDDHLLLRLNILPAKTSCFCPLPLIFETHKSSVTFCVSTCGPSCYILQLVKVLFSGFLNLNSIEHVSLATTFSGTYNFLISCELRL